MGSFDDEMAPGGSVRGEGLPALSADVEVVQRDLQAVLESFSLPSDCALALTEFSVEKLLWNAIVWHARDVVFASRLGLAHDGNDAGKVCLVQDLRVGDFVLPAGCGEHFRGICYGSS